MSKIDHHMKLNSDETTLIPLLRIPSLGRIGSIKLVLPKWQNIDILNRGIRVTGATYNALFYEIMKIFKTDFF